MAGSILLNGISEYLSISDNINLRPGTSNFTVEAWVYLNDYSNTNMLISKDNALADGGAGSWYFGMNNGTGNLQFGHSTTDYQGATGAIVPLKQWCHVAYVRNGSTWTTWLNGGSPSSTTLSLDLNGAGELRVGRGRSSSSNYFSGYIFNLRLTIGTALYTSAFSPPTETLTATANTSLLVGVSMTSTPIADFSVNNWNIVRNGNTGLYSTSAFDPFENRSTPSVAFTADSISGSFASGFTSFIKANSGTTKTLLIDTTDALTNPSITNPEQGFSTESTV